MTQPDEPQPTDIAFDEPLSPEMTALLEQEPEPADDVDD
jgi:hypothetical protein